MLTHRIETTAVVSGNRGVEERTVKGTVEYYYSIDYAYTINGREYKIPFEHGSSDKAFAERILHEKLNDSIPLRVWYDESNPSKASFEKTDSEWPPLAGMLVMMVMCAIYLGWLLLKIYEVKFLNKSR